MKNYTITAFFLTTEYTELHGDCTEQDVHQIFLPQRNTKYTQWNTKAIF